MKKVFYIGVMLALLLTACVEEKTTTKEDATTIEQKSKEETVTVESSNWQKEISMIAANSNGTADKFNALEKFLIEYKATEKEIKEFSTYIVADYKSGSYLNDIGNHEKMLTNILKSYYVEKNSDGALKDFAFDYFQNMKYTYRGVDTVDSEAVKSNEKQMNKALKEIK